jgi:hypothetical protein
VAVIAALPAVAACANALGGAFVPDDRPFLVDKPHLNAPHDLTCFFTGNLYAYSNLPVSTSVYRPSFFAVLWLVNLLWPWPFTWSV